MSNAVNPIPENYHSITCYLTVPDGNRALDFYTTVFGAKVVSRNDLPDGQPAHAELLIGDSTIQVGMPIPESGLIAPNGETLNTSIVHYCPDVDGVIERGRDAGARIADEPATFVTGDRYAVLYDPFGYRWVCMTRVEDVPREEAERRVNEWMAQQG